MEGFWGGNLVTPQNPGENAEGKPRRRLLLRRLGRDWYAVG